MESLHPFAIHAPLTLVVLWPLLDLAGLIAKKPDWSTAAVGILGLALVASLVATASGQAAFDVAVAAQVDPKLLRTHSDDADLMPWILIVLLGARLFGPAKLGMKGRVAAIVLGLVGAGFVFKVGQSGGALVYEHGVGVKTTSKSE